jgi:ATP-dependent Lon protease
MMSEHDNNNDEGKLTMADQEYIPHQDEESTNSNQTTNNVYIHNMQVNIDVDNSSAIPPEPIENTELKEASQADLDDLLNTYFKGRVVRKDLTKLLKEGANVPVYVLEYLLGMYCATNDDDVVREGMENVKKILVENYVRPDEAQKIISLIRERGTYKIIDKVNVKLNQRKDVYEAAMANLGVKDAVMPTKIVKVNEKLLTGDIWCIVTLQYFYEEGQKTSPFSVMSLKPIQMP